MSNPILETALVSALQKRIQREAEAPELLARRLGLTLDDWQVNVCRSKARRLMLCCSRQAGKSTVSALLAIHQATFRPGSLVIVVSPSLRQSVETFRKIAEFHAAGLNEEAAATSESMTRLELSNESRILSLPGGEKNIRGFSAPALIVIDEAARVADELYAALRPMLAVSHGRLIALSSPFGRRGWFYEAWSKGEGWERYRVSAYECPRISEEFLEDERRSLPDLVFRSEYLCEFSEVDGAVFLESHTRQMFDEAAPVAGWWSE